MTRPLLLAALFFAAAGTAAPARSATDKDVNIQALQVRELQILRDGEVKFSESLSEFNKLLAQNPERGTSARTRLQQLALQLEDSAGELKSRFEFASRYPPNRDELAKLKKPWEKFLSERTPAVRDLIREGRDVARTAPGQPVRGPAPKGEADIDLAQLSRDTGVPLGPPVSRGSPDALPIPPGPANRPAPGAVAPQAQQTVAQPPPSQAPATTLPATGSVYFAVLSPAYRTSDAEWSVPECRFREVAKTRTNYGSRTEAESDASRMRSSGYADVEARYFDTFKAMDEFTRDWAARRASDSKRCNEAYAAAKQRANARP